MNFTVDQDKCTNCGRCSADCPVLIINNKTEFPSIKEGKEGMCLKCQHCLAVCPEGAISIWGKEPENSISVDSPMPDVEALENLIQTRRSIRKFKKQELDKAVINRLVNMASYAPTAKNENDVLFSVVDNREDMAKLTALTYEYIKRAGEENKLAPTEMHFKKFQEVWDAKKIDILFRNAPHMLIFSAPQTGTEPVVDSTIAASYFELLANSQGIGTMWDGFAKSVFEDVTPEIKAEIGIPEDHKIAMVLLFGEPAVKFTRSIQNEANLNQVTLD